MLTEPIADTNWLSKEADRYLSIYVAELKDTTWNNHIARMSKRLQSQGLRDEELKDRLRKIVACTILLPSYDKYRIPDPPENLIYWCPSFHQFEERDWSSLIEEVHEQDVMISKWRNQCQGLGIIDPIDYSPITRQAFNWLIMAAQDAGDLTSENRPRIEQSFKKLVYAYGGAVICAVFQSHEALIKRKVLNWRSNYFFERLIFEAYSVDQVVKIKRQELKKTNPKLVKQLRKI